MISERNDVPERRASINDFDFYKSLAESHALTIDLRDREIRRLKQMLRDHGIIKNFKS